MGLWDRLRGVGPEGYRQKRARKLESEGELAAAAEAFLDARLPDEAARMWLLRADAEPKLERRIAFLEQAAQLAQSEEQKRKAQARRARLSFDLLRDRAALAKSEVLQVAEQLLLAGEAQVAAEAFALVGDVEGEIRALTAAGAIDKLEDRLAGDAERARRDQQIAACLARMQDLDRACERSAALALARSLPQSDRRVSDLAQEIAHRVLRGPSCELAIAGQPLAVVLGSEVTVGRGDASLVVASRSLSRVHLRLFRDEARVPHAEDAGTKNGTFLGGARLSGPVPIGAGISLKIGDLECGLTSADERGVWIEIAGERQLAPLGPLVLDACAIDLIGAGRDERSFVVLERRGERPLFRHELELGPRVELCAGDEISTARGAPPWLSLQGARGT